MDRSNNLYLQAQAQLLNLYINSNVMTEEDINLSIMEINYTLNSMIIENIRFIC